MFDDVGVVMVWEGNFIFVISDIVEDDIVWCMIGIFSVLIVNLCQQVVGIIVSVFDGLCEVVCCCESIMVNVFVDVVLFVG